MIEYKGYTGVFEYDPTVDRLHGRVIGLRDVVTFEARSIDELRQEMADSVEDYLEFCGEIGKDPERPYRGEFLVRTTPDLHRALASEAEAKGVSLNAWVEGILMSSAGVKSDSGHKKASRRPRAVPSRTKSRGSSKVDSTHSTKTTSTKAGPKRRRAKTKA